VVVVFGGVVVGIPILAFCTWTISDEIAMSRARRAVNRVTATTRRVTRTPSPVRDRPVIGRRIKHSRRVGPDEIRSRPVLSSGEQEIPLIGTISRSGMGNPFRSGRMSTRERYDTKR
jgi:hypothetical protein